MLRSAKSECTSRLTQASSQWPCPDKVVDMGEKHQKVSQRQDRLSQTNRYSDELI